MVCLDTSFVVDFLRGQKAAVKRMEELVSSSRAIATSAPTVMELTVGATLSQSQDEAEKIKDLLSSMIVLPLDVDSAIYAGETDANLALAGETMGTVDIQIGSIAVTNKEPLLTRNAKHFLRIPGLVIETY